MAVANNALLETAKRLATARAAASPKADSFLTAALAICTAANEVKASAMSSGADVAREVGAQIVCGCGSALQKLVAANSDSERENVRLKWWIKALAVIGLLLAGAVLGVGLASHLPQFAVHRG